MTNKITAAIRNDKKDATGLVPIYIYIYSGSKRVSRIAIGKKVHVDFWDNVSHRVNKRFENADLINNLINKKISELEGKILTHKIMTGAVDLSEVLQKEIIKEIDFYQFAEKQITEKNYADETRRSYRLYVSKMKTYRKTLRLTDINYQFLQGYEAYLRDELKNSINTVWGNMKFINTMANDALKFKYLKVNPFTIYTRPKYKQTARGFLNASELKKIEDFTAKTQDEGFKIVASYFLFMCYSGLRFSDAIRFRAKDHIVEGQRIVIETQKTKQVTNLYINEKIKPLIDFVSANPFLITQTYFNRRLKDIADHLGITKKVSSHTARHSFGTALAALGVPEKVAQGLLAHSSAASTRIYYHLEAPSLDEAMKKFNQ